MSPLRTYIETKKGPRGWGKVTVLPKVVQVELDVEEGGRTRSKTFEIDRANAPDNVRDGEFNVALNYDETVLYGLRPAGPAEYPAVYAGMPHDEGQPPTPTNDPGRKWGFTSKTTGKWVERVDPPSRVFDTQWRILSPPNFQDLIVPLRLRFLFAEYEDTGEAMVWAEGGRPWSSWAKDLLNTMKIAGFDPVTDSLPFSNEGGPTLRALDEIWKEANKVVNIKVSKSGWGNRIKPAAEGLSVEQFESGPSVSELNSKTVAELKDMARDANLSGYSTLNKDGLIDLLYSEL